MSKTNEGLDTNPAKAGKPAADNDAKNGGDNAPQKPAAAQESGKQEESGNDPEPSVMDRARSFMKSKPAMQAQLNKASEEIAGLKKQVSGLQATVESQNAELTRLRQLEKDLTETVEALENDRKSVTEAATDLAAQAGVPADELPKHEEGDGETLESLQERMAATSDPVEKGKLAARARELRWES